MQTWNRYLAALALLAVLPACGGGGSSPTGPGPAPAPTPVPTPTPEVAAFGPGQHRVNTTIAPGRYFSDPNSGCYWERQSGPGATLGDVIANDFIGFDARQAIVDILPTDLAFDTDAQCGNWYRTPRQPAQTTVQPGWWLVGAQIAPGTYQATNPSGGCYWERLRDFEGHIRSIIANDFVSGAGPRLVAIGSNDVGFHSNTGCGPWTVSLASVGARTQSLADIERAWRLNRTTR